MPSKANDMSARTGAAEILGSAMEKKDCSLGLDDFSKEGSFEFANMKATSTMWSLCKPVKMFQTVEMVVVGTILRYRQIPKLLQ